MYVESMGPSEKVEIRESRPATIKVEGVTTKYGGRKKKERREIRKEVGTAQGETSPGSRSPSCKWTGRNIEKKGLAKGLALKRGFLRLLVTEAVKNLENGKHQRPSKDGKKAQKIKRANLPSKK